MSEINSCDAVWELLSVYADGEASSAEAQIVEEHVSKCKACGTDLQFLLETASVLSATKLVSPPPGLRQAILAATVYKPTWQERLRSAFAAGLPMPRVQLAGGAAVVILAGIVLFKSAQLPDAGAGNRSPRSPGKARSAEQAPRYASTSPESSSRSAGRSTTRGLSQSVGSDRIVSQLTARSADLNQLAAISQPETSVATRRSAVSTAPSVLRRASLREADDTRLAAVSTPKPADIDSLNEPADMRDIMGPMDMDDMAPIRLAKNETSSENKAEAASSPAKSPTRYTLTASLSSGAAEGMVTFADLRSALRKRNEPARTVALDLGVNDRNAMWDVYKSRF